MKTSRRRFLAGAAATAAAPYVITSTALGARGVRPASDRVTVGKIGCGGRGGGIGGVGGQIVAACDPWKPRRERYARGGAKPFDDFRELLAQDNIDAVAIATPDHWHVLTAIAAVRAGLDEAGETAGIRSGIIVTGLRTIAPEASLAVAKLAVAWKNRGVVAFDLAGDEADHPAKRHLQAFYHVLNNNQNVTIHAGEGFGPESIHQALHRCGANRIGHGTRLEEDPELMAYVADHRVPLEVCLSSNLQSGVVEDLATHPFRHYLQQGLRVCLNTDNTLFARTTSTRELRLAVDTFDLTLLETENLLLNGFKSAFLPEKSKEKLVREAIETFASLRDKFGLDERRPAP